MPGLFFCTSDRRVFHRDTLQMKCRHMALDQTTVMWSGKAARSRGFLHLCSGAWLSLRPSPLVLHLCWTMCCPAPHYRLVPAFPISMGSSGKLQALWVTLATPLTPLWPGGIVLWLVGMPHHLWIDFIACLGLLRLSPDLARLCQTILDIWGSQA